ncbi:hypothetical protein BG015_005916 [Linnemannia schmuckeri]|uniref:Uncharacterized protein n=1 Tax=Linnemannia schmuckeri TaxID=64567 RepID=A0A9P5VBU6_9FUNG|nr:hypothetical protein BG015_005916 [Linnemannia schmuckeri]
MAFTLGVEDASGFYKYLINVIVVTASVAWLLLLFIRSIDSKVYREFKPFSIAMSLQLLFVTVRNLTTLLLSSEPKLEEIGIHFPLCILKRQLDGYQSGFPIQCRWVAVGGIIIYQGFAISAECAMLIRCRSFTRYPRAVTYMTIPTWIVRFALCIWLATTMKGQDNVAGTACDIVMDLQMSAIMQYLKIATEIIIVVFFLERVISLHRHEGGIITGDTQHHHWRRLALINAGITFLVVLFEILVGQITVYLTDYLFLTYSMVNLIQATLCVFIVEDTRSVFKERAAAAQNNSGSNNTNSNQGSGGAPRHSTMSGPVVVSSRYDDRDEDVVSYADAIAAAKAARHSQESQKPWSLTMRPPGGDMHSPAQIHHSLASQSPHTYYMDNMGSSSPDSKRTMTPQRWRSGEAEDEIPMTRTTKASQDGGAYY